MSISPSIDHTRETQWFSIDPELVPHIWRHLDKVMRHYLDDLGSHQEFTLFTNDHDAVRMPMLFRRNAPAHSDFPDSFEIEEPRSTFGRKAGISKRVSIGLSQLKCRICELSRFGSIDPGALLA